MKRLLILLLTLPFLLGISVPKDLVESTQKSIVKLEYRTGPNNEDLYTCTGFVVSAVLGDVLTAAHCLPKDPNNILYINGEVAKTIRTSESLALVRITPFNMPALTVRREDPRLGEEAISFGYAWRQFTVFNRNVAALLGSDIGLDGPLAPGMSGGPIVDLSGKVIAINQATNEVVGLACGAEEIREFLENK